MDSDLKDVHVLVTGANGGIGLETMRLFIEHGACVTAHYCTSAAALIQLQTGINHARLRTVQPDLSHEEQVRALFFSSRSSTGEEEDAWGEVEIAVINHGASLSIDVLIKDMSIEQW